MKVKTEKKNSGQLRNTSKVKEFVQAWDENEKICRNKSKWEISDLERKKERK